MFEKNPNYWDAANVKLNTIKFFLSNDDDAIYANFTNGTIQYTTTVPVSQIPVLKADPTRMNVDFFIGDYIGTYFLEVNVNWSFKPGLAVTSDTADAWEGWTPAQNAEVRHALALLIDRNYIVEQVTAGGQLPAYGFVPAGMDDGTGTDRTILSGIHAYYEPEQLIGKTCIAITNLPPRAMMGIESCGMLLSAIHKEGEEEKLHLLMVDPHIPAGAKLY